MKTPDNNNPIYDKSNRFSTKIGVGALAILAFIGVRSDFGNELRFNEDDIVATEKATVTPGLGVISATDTIESKLNDRGNVPTRDVGPVEIGQRLQSLAEGDIIPGATVTYEVDRNGDIRATILNAGNEATEDFSF